MSFSKVLQKFTCMLCGKTLPSVCLKIKFQITLFVNTSPYVMMNSHTLFGSVWSYLSLHVTYDIPSLCTAILGQLLSTLNTTNLFNLSSYESRLTNTCNINVTVCCKHIRMYVYLYTKLHRKSAGAPNIPTYNTVQLKIVTLIGNFNSIPLS